MKKIMILLIISLFLSSCSYHNPEDIKKIADLEKQINNEIFNKNKECFELKEKIKNNLDSDYMISEIFYSPKLNTCISRIVNIKPPQLETMNNVLTGKEIMFRYDMCSGNNIEPYDKCIERQKKYSKKIEELKQK